METFQSFLRRKNIIISARRYGIDALGAMAQGLFASLLIGTILNTVGTQFGVGFLTAQIITINGTGYTIGGLASFMSGPAMAVAIGYALQAPPLVLFSLVTAGYACNALGGAGGPLAVLLVAIIAAECGKAVSKETKIDILVTPIVTILAGIGFAKLIAAPIGAAASAVGQAIMWATELQPFFMGIIVSVIIGIALTLPISSAAICAALGLTGLAGGAAVVLVYQGLLTVLGWWLGGLLPPAELNVLDATGGIILMALGLRLAGIARLAVAEMVPALVLAPVGVVIVGLVT